MKREEKVCTIEQSVKLKNLGVIQKSEYYHSINSYDSRFKEITVSPDNRDEIYSAFDVSELGIMLYGFDLPQWAFKRKMFKVLINPKDRVKYFNNEAEARAELVIWLLQNHSGFSVDLVNKRLSEEVSEAPGNNICPACNRESLVFGEPIPYCLECGYNRK